MTDIQITPEQYINLNKTQKPVLIDMRDINAYTAGHIDNAIHIEDIIIDIFVEDFDQEQSLVICCYHGHSSISAAAQFKSLGIKNAFSLVGGYEGWPYKK